MSALVLFAGLGMLPGSDGLGRVRFDDYRLARLIGTFALVLVLYEVPRAIELPNVVFFAVLSATLQARRPAAGSPRVEELARTTAISIPSARRVADVGATAAPGSARARGAE